MHEAGHTPGPAPEQPGVWRLVSQSCLQRAARCLAWAQPSAALALGTAGVRPGWPPAHRGAQWGVRTLQPGSQLRNLQNRREPARQHVATGLGATVPVTLRPLDTPE